MVSCSTGWTVLSKSRARACAIMNLLENSRQASQEPSACHSPTIAPPPPPSLPNPKACLLSQQLRINTLKPVQKGLTSGLLHRQPALKSHKDLREGLGATSQAQTTLQIRKWGAHSHNCSMHSPVGMCLLQLQVTMDEAALKVMGL